MIGILLGAAFLAGALFNIAAAVLVVPTAALILRGDRHGVFATAVIGLAVFAGAWRVDPPPSFPVPTWTDDISVIRGTLVSAPTRREPGESFELRLTSVETDGGPQVSAASIWVSTRSPTGASRGDTIVLSGDVQPVADQRPSFADYLESIRIDAVIFASSVRIEARGTGWLRVVDDLRRGITGRMQRAAPGDAGTLLAGLVNGDDDAMSEARRDAFVRTGTSHITAVSGANFAIVLAMAMTVGRVSGIRRFAAWQLTTAVLIWGYAILVGLEPPALRAALVATAAVLAVRLGRRPDYITLLALAAALQVAFRPDDLWTLSYQLSTASSLALALVLPGLAPDSLLGWLRASVVASWVAQVATLPVLIPSFGTLSLTGVPANLLIAPAVAVAFPLAVLSAMVSPVSPILGSALAGPAALLADYVFAVVTLLGRTGTVVVPGDLPRSMTYVPLALVSTSIIVAMSRDCRLWLARINCFGKING